MTDWVGCANANDAPIVRREYETSPDRHRRVDARGRERSTRDVEEDAKSGSDDGEIEYIEEEEGHRNRLIAYEKEQEKLTEKMMRSLRVLKTIDEERAREAETMANKKIARARELEREKAEKNARRAREAERSRRTCGGCHRVFVDERAKDRRYEAVHDLSCWCGREFHSRHSFHQHKTRLAIEMIRILYFCDVAIQYCDFEAVCSLHFWLSKVGYHFIICTENIVVLDLSKLLFAIISRWYLVCFDR
ncbi:hypothetical protein ACHAXS_002028 [Conticribra weissflogii]